MFCNNCGKIIPDTARFCPGCGAIQRGQQPAAWDDEGYDDVQSATWDDEGYDDVQPEAWDDENYDDMQPASWEPERQTPRSGKRRARGGNKGLITIIVVAAAVLLVAGIAVVVVLKTRTQTIRVSKYVNITIEGYNTVGKASYEIDTSAFADDYGSKLRLNSKRVRQALEQVGEETGEGADESMLEALEALDQLGSYGDSYVSGMLQSAVWSVLDGELDQTSDLSNGDTVTFHWDYSEEDLALLETLLGYEFEVEDIAESVSGLQEIDTFDPFDGVTVSFAGMAPDAYVDTITSGSDEACAVLTYTASPKKNLRVGDTIMVTASCDYYSDEELADRYGRIPGKRTKEFTVSGVDSVPVSASEIPDEIMEQMRSIAEAEYQTYVRDYFDETEEFVDLTYLGNYYRTLQDMNGARVAFRQASNAITFVYRPQVYLNDTGETFEYYWYCKFEEIIQSADGSWSADLENYVMPVPPVNVARTGLHGFRGFGDAVSTCYELAGQYHLDYYIEDNIEDETLRAADTYEEEYARPE